MMAEAVSALKQACALRWAALEKRERLWAGMAAALMVCALIWWVGVAPAWQRLQSARQLAPSVSAQLALMRQWAQEASSLQSHRPLGANQTAQVLEQSVSSMGPGARLSLSGSSASVSVQAVSAERLAAWLVEVRANARLMPQELRLKKSQTPQGVTWDGSIRFDLEGLK